MALKLFTLFLIIITFGIFLIFFQAFLVEFYSNNGEVIVFDSKTSIILWWTPFGSFNKVRKCDYSHCYFTSNRTLEYHQQLKAILYYGSNFKIEDLPRWRSPLLIWGLMHEESPRNNPILVHEETLNLFNYSSTFSRYSDIPLNLIDLPSLEKLTGNEYFVKTKDKNIVMNRENLSSILYIQSDCETASDRDLYVKELMKHIPIDSYGACLNNRNLSERLKENHLEILNHDEFLHFVAKFKFTIAFENAICNDYITEKLWRPLIVGSVPIYYGSPSFKDWLPNVNSAISILDFSGPKELADHISFLSSNDLEYEKHLSHKLNNQDEKVTNRNLTNALKNRIQGVINEFGVYVEQFECFICKKVQNDILQQNMVKKEHLDCPMPKNPLTNQIDENNWWVSQWKIEKCAGKLLNQYINNNISISINTFNKKKLELYERNNC
ncbi:alpha-(1,3)-fucosyltransferase 10 [Prorops nasuta]|uniref:alpha-(1,3)-fucosyltransferase 10 n=1 Tax=Prorops nasuta TaxID=863751 RepID=UPI0034CF38F8